MLKILNYLKMLKQVSYLSMHMGRRGGRLMSRVFGLIQLAWALHLYMYIAVSSYLPESLVGVNPKMYLKTGIRNL